jgi:uncharacterized protein (DUF486 family)
VADAMNYAVLLTISSAFMTVAWYGHFKHRSMALWSGILMRWAIAFGDYVFQVPANPIGSRIFSLTQLNVGQECITLAVFLVYAFTVFREVPRWNTMVSMALIVGAVYFAFLGKS